VGAHHGFRDRGGRCRDPRAPERFREAGRVRTPIKVTLPTLTAAVKGNISGPRVVHVSRGRRAVL
jgi:hypothetical protein